MASTYTRLKKLYRIQNLKVLGKVTNLWEMGKCQVYPWEKQETRDLKQAADPKGRKETNIYLQLSLINVFTFWTIGTYRAQLHISSFSSSLLFYVTTGQGDKSSNIPKTWQQNPRVSQLNLESTFQEYTVQDTIFYNSSRLSQMLPYWDAVWESLVNRLPGAWSFPPKK